MTWVCPKRRVCTLDTTRKISPEIRSATPEFYSALNYKSLKRFKHNGLNSTACTTIQQISDHSRKMYWVSTRCFAPGQPLDSVCWGCHDGPSVCTALVPNENDQNFLLKIIFINYTHFVKRTYPKSLIREFTKIICLWPY